MSVLVVTEREGTLIISVTTPDGSTRQRAALDVEGTDLSHAELAEFAQDLSGRFLWNGTPALEPPPRVKAHALPAAPVEVPEEELRLRRKRAFNRDYYRRNRSKDATRKADPPKPVPAPKHVRTPEEADAFRDALLQDVRAHPGTTVKGIAERLTEPDSDTNIYARGLMDAGRLRREGGAHARDPFRYYVTEETT